MSTPPQVSVILCSHNPDPARLDRTLRGLWAQTLPAATWELLVIDNGSAPPVAATLRPPVAGPNLRLAAESRLGLSHARRRGLTLARAPLVVLVDDDNVLAPDYLEHAVRLFAAHPRLGAAGGRILPEFESPPPEWAREFFPLLALRDGGKQPIFAEGLRPPGALRNAYPVEAAPIGAGMVLRLAAVRPWSEETETSLTDRRGAELSSGGDNDLVFAVLRAGWQVGYIPELRLTHLIPSARLEPVYLAQLNRGIQKSWMQVLRKHDANPWPPIARWTVPLRQAKAWFTHRAWSSPAAHIRWHGACGHFEGRRD